MSWNANFHFEYGETLNGQKIQKLFFIIWVLESGLETLKNACYVH